MNTEMPPARSLSPEQAARLFRLLGKESRLRVLLLLAEEGEVNVKRLRLALGQSQPNISHHLALLRRARLVVARRDGQRSYYRISAALVRELLRLACGS
jgi:ArsR family transcriptional regulator, arsenate/arsenite/antimonite-responsive transcriptional repressor